jgi:hypothetical protein
MATRERKLQIMQELADRGDQDLLPPEKRAIFDQLVANGAITLKEQATQAAPGPADFSQADALGRPPEATPSQVGIEQGGQDESITAQIDRQIGLIVEPAVAIGSGALAEPIAGLSGLFQAINPFADEGAGERAVAGVREALTFQPESAEGKIGLRNVAEFAPIKKFIEVLEGSEKALGDIGFKIGMLSGIPEVAGAFGAFGASIPTAVLEGLGFVSLKNLRLGKAKLIDKKTGRPNPELQKALDDAGVDFDDFNKDQLAELGNVGEVRGEIPVLKRRKEGPRQTQADAQKAQAEEIARAARAEEIGVTLTGGQRTQDFQQLTNEQRLITTINKQEVARPLRQLEAENSAAFIKNVDDMVDGLGGTLESGEILKGALDGRLKLLQKEKSALYKEFADTAPETAAIPIITDTITEAMQPQALRRQIQTNSPSGVKALDELLVEFGIDKDPGRVKRFNKPIKDADGDIIEVGRDITPLTIGNFDTFRKAINAIESADQKNSFAIKVLSGPIKRALDNEAGLVDDAARAAGVTDEGVLKPLTEARKVVREIKTEFSPNAIAGKLTKAKPDGFTPMVEASKAFDEVMAPGKPVEFLERTLEQLNKAGPEGQQAIRALQATTMFRIIDKALQGAEKFGDQVIFSPTVFRKTLNTFAQTSKGGKNRLNILFKGNPKLLADLRRLEKVAKDLSPPGRSVPKGSAPILLDLAESMKKLPGFRIIGDTLEKALNIGADTRTINRALATDPQFSRGIKLLTGNFPRIAAALGIGLVSGEVEKRKSAITGVQVDLPGGSQILNPEGQLVPGTIDEGPAEF